MNTFQAPLQIQSPTLLESSCGYLLQELQIIWEEIGEHAIEREKALLDLEQECVEVYSRKVDAANTSRARLHQELADSEAEFTHLLLSLGERSLPARPEKMTGTLKEQVESITPALREMRSRKEERLKQFRDVQGQIHKLSKEITGKQEWNDSSSTPSHFTLNESDLSLKRLEEYQNEMQRLQNEKSCRLQRVERYRTDIQKLAGTLGVDSVMILKKVHSSLIELDGGSKNISDCILGELDATVRSLEEEKKQRLEKIQVIGKALINLWDLMDIHHEDRQPFIHITKLLSVLSTEISDSRSLSIDTIEKCEAEVKRLDHLKSSKMKELFLKKQIELEDICNKSHMEFVSQLEMENIINLMNSGEIDHAELLTNMDEQISRAKEEAFSRNAIMEKADKWMAARNEERWLEEYSRDENRYSVSRGAHRNLRRAERARITVNRIPALVDLLITKTKTWEEERNKIFFYDEVPLLEMLMEYILLRQESEEEKQRQRDKKKIPTQVVTERDKFSKSRPSTSSNLSLSNQSFNESFSVTNRRPSLRIRKNPRAHEVMFPHHQITSHHRDETASEVSTLSGHLSP